MAPIRCTARVTLDPDMPLARALAPRDGAFGAAVDATLLARLDLKPGARLTIGNATIEITAVIQNEPDKLASGIGVRPARDRERRRRCAPPACWCPAAWFAGAIACGCRTAATAPPTP